MISFSLGVRAKSWVVSIVVRERYDAAWLLVGYEGQLSPRQTDPSASRPARPRAAPPPRRAPLRPNPPEEYPSFGFDMKFVHIITIVTTTIVIIITG